MFEDSTFDSTGRIHTRSRGWMIATCAFDGFILLLLVLIPLIYPEALPRMAMAFLMEAPPAPVAETKPPVRVEHTDQVPTQIRAGQIFAPTVIPSKPFIPAGPEVLTHVTIADADLGGGKPDGDILFNGQAQHSVVRQRVSGPVRVSGMVVEGLLIRKTIPVYPPIAKATRTQGTVVLQANIARNGTIENLRVVSGSPMLQQAALDAVKTWLYRPYLLSGEPVEVETTVNVVFTLQQ